MLLAGYWQRTFSQEWLLSIVLLCQYRTASYGISRIIIITDVTEAYSMRVRRLLQCVLSSGLLDA